MAHRLLGKKNPLDARVLDELIGRPKRYSELREAIITGRTDTPLTRALHRLRRDGLIRGRSDISENPPVDRYELTHLGADVLFMIHNIQFVVDLHARMREQAADAGS